MNLLNKEVSKPVLQSVHERYKLTKRMLDLIVDYNMYYHKSFTFINDEFENLILCKSDKPYLILQKAMEMVNKKKDSQKYFDPNN